MCFCLDPPRRRRRLAAGLRRVRRGAAAVVRAAAAVHVPEARSKCAPRRAGGFRSRRRRAAGRQGFLAVSSVVVYPFSGPRPTGAKRPANFPGSLRPVADESVRRRAGVRTLRRGTPLAAARCLPVRSSAVRPLPYDGAGHRGFAIEAATTRTAPRLHIGAAQRRASAGKVPHSEGRAPPAERRASGSKVPTPIA